jgi:protease I
MSDVLRDRRVAILAADGVERVELEEPRQAVEDAGAQVELLSIHDGEIAARNNDLEDAGTFTVDRLVADASVDDYDALLLPGGTVNPDKLRMDERAVDFVREFFNSGKPVGTICHGPWTLLEAGVLSGRRVTSFPSLRTDLRNAGANVADEEVVVDQGLVSSRSPDDLPAFCAKVVEEFAAGTPIGWSDGVLSAISHRSSASAGMIEIAPLRSRTACLICSSRSTPSSSRAASSTSSSRIFMCAMRSS